MNSKEIVNVFWGKKKSSVENNARRKWIKRNINKKNKIKMKQ